MSSDYVVSSSANLFGFRTSTGASVDNVYLDTTGRLSIRNNIGGVTTYSTTVPSNGAWHLISLHTVIGASTGAIDVSLDGAAVPSLSLTNQNLGSAAIAKLQVGETTTGRTYDIAIDSVQVSSSTL